MAKNVEVEQKYKVSSPAKLRAVLKKMGAKKIASGLEINELFDCQGRLAGQGSVLRLRRHGQKQVLTFKGPRLKGAYKKRTEIETPIDFDNAKLIFKQLGYKKVLSYRKKREEYSIANAHITLDQIGSSKWFCEIEGAPSVIKRYERLLGFSSEDVEHRTYLEIMGKSV